MTIARRQVIGWGALGLGAVAVDGCALPWGKSPTASPDDVDRLLAELDRVVADLQTLEPDVEGFGIKPGGAYVAQGEVVCKRLLTALCSMGTLRDVPRALWREPRIEQRLMQTLPRIHTALEMALESLANIDEAEGARIDKRLHDDPDLPMHILEHIDDLAKKVHVPVDQRVYLRTATTQLASRMRYEGTKDVMTGLATKYHRAVVTRLGALGIPGDPDAGASSTWGTDADAGADAGAGADGGTEAGDEGGAEQQKTEPEPIRVRFHTRATPSQVHYATCSLQPTLTVDGAKQQVVLDWEEFRCPVTIKLSNDQPLIHGAVHTEPGADGRNTVTLVLYPTSESQTDALTQGATALARELQRRLTASVAAPPPSPPQPRLGDVGESCRTSADCDSALTCDRGVCGTGEEETSSAKLIKTTKAVAKWGAYLSIPPICAIGALVLLTCLFMVIVAGCMYADGD
jgi:hypothetical protein